MHVYLREQACLNVRVSLTEAVHGRHVLSLDDEQTADHDFAVVERAGRRRGCSRLSVRTRGVPLDWPLAGLWRSRRRGSTGRRAWGLSFSASVRASQARDDDLYTRAASGNHASGGEECMNESIHAVKFRGHAGGFEFARIRFTLVAERVVLGSGRALAVVL